MKNSQISEVLNALPIPLIAFRIANGELVAYNSRADEMLLLSNKEKADFSMLFPTSGVYTGLYAAIKNLSAGDMLEEHIIELRKMNGRKISCSLSFSVQKMDKDLLCFFSLTEDRGTQYLKSLVQLAQRLRKVQAPLERIRSAKKKSGGVVSAVTLDHELGEALGELQQIVKLFELKT